MKELGIAVPIDDLPLHKAKSAVDRLVASGYQGIWTGELNAVEGLMPLALCAGWHPTVSLSCAVVSVYTRGPATLALSASTLSEVSEAPVRFGIGAGSAVIAETWNGSPFTSPYIRVRETLAFLRAVLNGEPASEQNTTFSSRNFKLARPPRVPPAIVLGVLGPRMQALAAAEADGMVVNFLSATDMHQVTSQVADVARVVDSPFEVTARVFVMAGQSDKSLDMARRHIAGYLTVPAYANFQRWLGRGDALTPMWKAWADGDRRAAARAIPEELARDLILMGDPRECARVIRAYEAGGADVINVCLLPDGGETDSEERVRFLCDLSTAIADVG